MKYKKQISLKTNKRKIIQLLTAFFCFVILVGSFQNCGKFSALDLPIESSTMSSSAQANYNGAVLPEDKAQLAFVKPHDGIMFGELYGPTYRSGNFLDFLFGREYRPSEGSSGIYYNGGVHLTWHQQGGDWVNEDLISQALTTTSSLQIFNINQDYEIDVLSYLKRWRDNQLLNSGFLLVGDPLISSYCLIASRVKSNLEDSLQGPELKLVFQDGTFENLKASATTSLAYGQYSTVGNADMQVVAGSSASARTNSLIFFDHDFTKKKPIQSAKLKIVATQKGGSSPFCGVMVMAARYPGREVAADSRVGAISEIYPSDIGLSLDPDVISYLVPPMDFFKASHFTKIYSIAVHNETKWKISSDALSDGARAKDYAVIDNSYIGQGFRPIPGISNWFKVTYPGVPQGATQPGGGPLNGLFDIYNVFEEDQYLELKHPKVSGELDEVYISALVQMGSDAKLNCGGKLGPAVFGINGAMNIDLNGNGTLKQVLGSGNGGAKSTGDGGWSSRFSYGTSEVYSPRTVSILRPQGNPADEFFWGTTYIYHKNQTGVYGDTTPDSSNGNQVMKIGQIYQLEMRVKLNTAPALAGLGPPNADGIVQQWINDRILEDRRDLVFRNQMHSRFYRRGTAWSDIPSRGPSDPVDEVADYLKGRNAIRQAGIEVYYGGDCINRDPITVFVSRIIVSKKPIGRLRIK